MPNQPEVPKPLNQMGLSKNDIDSSDLKQPKTLRFPQNQTNELIKQLAPSYKGIHLEKIPLKKLVEDNDLLNDDDLESYHELVWNNAKAKDFHIDNDKINATRMSGIPFVVKKNGGKYILSDGRHRTRAAHNDGYEFAEYPVYDEENK